VKTPFTSKRSRPCGYSVACLGDGRIRVGEGAVRIGPNHYLHEACVVAAWGSVEQFRRNKPRVIYIS